MLQKYQKKFFRFAVFSYLSASIFFRNVHVVHKSWTPYQTFKVGLTVIDPELRLETIEALALSYLSPVVTWTGVGLAVSGGLVSMA